MSKVKSYLSLIKFSHTIFAMPFALIGFFLPLRIEVVYGVGQWNLNKTVGWGYQVEDDLVTDAWKELGLLLLLESILVVVLKLWNIWEGHVIKKEQYYSFLLMIQKIK